jgi:hypothetical protein
VYQAQKVHLFRPGMNLLAEVWKQAKIKAAFWQRCTLHFLGDRTNYKAKDIIVNITNLFCIYLFQRDKFIKTY